MSDGAFQRLLQRAGGTGAPGSAAAPAASGALAPAKVLRLPPSAFADEWARKPAEPEAVGLRLVSEATASNATVMAARVAWEAHPEESEKQKRIDIFNNELMLAVLARATTDATDRTKPYFGKTAEDVIRIALNGAGVRRLWEAYERLNIESSPLSEELDDEAIEAFGKKLSEGVARGLDPATAGRVRRLLFAVAREFVAPDL